MAEKDIELKSLSIMDIFPGCAEIATCHCAKPGQLISRKKMNGVKRRIVVQIKIFSGDVYKIIK